MDHKTTLPFFSLRSQSSLGCCQIKLCIVTSWVVSTKLSLPSSFRIVSSRMASKTRARAPSISCLLCDGLVAYTRADRQRWPFQLMCLENVIGAISNVLQHAGLTATWKLSMERQQTSPICWQDAWWARWGQHIKMDFKKTNIQWFQTPTTSLIPISKHQCFDEGGEKCCFRHHWREGREQSWCCHCGGGEKIDVFSR